MSRTKKGKKPPGSEYWGKRPLSLGSCGGGTEDKRIGIQKERAILKRETAKEPIQPEYDPQEYVSDEDLTDIISACAELEAERGELPENPFKRPKRKKDAPSG